ncbi:MAG: hypothetical protein NTZ79_06615 [Proteobacteria bacterium]|nr:hypothetical protein [Pseudomonadota bacterium]
MRVANGRLLLASWCVLHVGAALAADAKPTTPDTEFLEFLGSGDDSELELQKYLVERESTTKAEAVKPAAKGGSEKP